MEAKIKKIFDYQRFEGNDRLKSICDDVEKKYAQMEELTDDDLYMVAAGTVIDKQKPATDDRFNKSGVTE